MIGTTAKTTRTARTAGRARDFRHTKKGWLYSAPAVLIFGAFVIIPTFYTFYVSLWNWNVLNPALSVYKGLGNYRELLTAADPSFTATLENSLYFTAAMVIVGTAISLGLALLLQRGGTVMNASRAAIYLPNATPLIATSLIWSWIYNPQFGLANWGLHLLHLPTSPWVEGQATAMPAVILFSLWHEVGFTTIVFLGGLTIINDEFGQAARVDGAGPWQEFWYITWPQLRPVTSFVIVITTMPRRPGRRHRVGIHPLPAVDDQPRVPGRTGRAPAAGPGRAAGRRRDRAHHQQRPHRPGCLSYPAGRRPVLRRDRRPRAQARRAAPAPAPASRGRPAAAAVAGLLDRRSLPQRHRAGRGDRGGQRLHRSLRTP